MRICRDSFNPCSITVVQIARFNAVGPIAGDSILHARYGTDRPCPVSQGKESFRLAIRLCRLHCTLCTSL